MVVPQTPLPLAKVLAQGGQDAQAGIEFDAVALAIVKADGLHVRKVLERPGQAGGGILPTGKEHQSVAVAHENFLE